MHFKARFFAIIKQQMGFSIQKYWLTGVLPAFRDGISPLSATKSISMSPRYNAACGLTEDEVRTIAKAYLASTHDETQLDKELEIMKRWFSGHRFSPSGDGANVSLLYNPQLVFTRLETVSLQAGYVYPDPEFSLTHIASTLNAIKEEGDLNGYDLLPLLSGNLRANIAHEFGVPEVKLIGRSADSTWTLLYYFGIITHGQGKDLGIPNLTMRRLVCVLPYCPFRFLTCF
jgi:Predicted AAA-ATPase